MAAMAVSGAVLIATACSTSTSTKTTSGSSGSGGAVSSTHASTHASSSVTSSSSTPSATSATTSSSGGSCSCTFVDNTGSPVAVVPCGGTSDCVDGGDYLTCSSDGQGTDMGSCAPADVCQTPSGFACSSEVTCCTKYGGQCCESLGCLSGYCCNPKGAPCQNDEDCCKGACDTSTKPTVCSM